MRRSFIACAALSFPVTAAFAPAVAATHAPPSTIATCTSSIVFGTTEWRAQTVVFRANVEIACPLGVPFSAALRSSNGCEMRSASGVTMRYELFADPAMRSPVVSCERATAALGGVGRQSFVVYGRVEGPVAATGEFHDALVTSITP